MTKACVLYKRLNFSKYGKIKLLKFKIKLFIKNRLGDLLGWHYIVTFQLGSAQLGKSQLEH